MGNTHLTTSLGQGNDGPSDRTCDCSRKSKYFERERCERLACCRRYSFGRLLNANHDLMMRIGSSYNSSKSYHNLPGPDAHPFVTFNRPYPPFGQSGFNTHFSQNQQQGVKQPPQPTDSNIYNPVTNTLRGHEPLNPFNPNNNLQNGPDQLRTGGDKNYNLNNPSRDNNRQLFPYNEDPRYPAQGQSVGTESWNRPIDSTGVPGNQGWQGAPGLGGPFASRDGGGGPGTQTTGYPGPNYQDGSNFEPQSSGAPNTAGYGGPHEAQKGSGGYNTNQTGYAGPNDAVPGGGRIDSPGMGYDGSNMNRWDGGGGNANAPGSEDAYGGAPGGGNIQTGAGGPYGNKSGVGGADNGPGIVNSSGPTGQGKDGNIQGAGGPSEGEPSWQDRNKNETVGPWTNGPGAGGPDSSISGPGNYDGQPGGAGGLRSGPGTPDQYGGGPGSGGQYGSPGDNYGSVTGPGGPYGSGTGPDGQYGSGSSPGGQNGKSAEPGGPYENGTRRGGPLESGAGPGGPQGSGAGTVGPNVNGSGPGGPNENGAGRGGPYGNDTGPGGPYGTGAGPGGPNGNGAVPGGPYGSGAGTGDPYGNGAGRGGPYGNGAGRGGPYGNDTGPGGPLGSGAGTVGPNVNVAEPGGPNGTGAGHEGPYGNGTGPGGPYGTGAGLGGPYGNDTGPGGPYGTGAGPGGPNGNVAGPGGSYRNGAGPEGPYGNDTGPGGPYGTGVGPGGPIGNGAVPAGPYGTGAGPGGPYGNDTRPGGPYGTSAGPGGPNGNVAGPGGSYGTGAGPGGPYGNDTRPGGPYGTSAGPGGPNGNVAGPGGSYGTGAGPGGPYGNDTGPGGSYGNGGVPGGPYGNGAGPGGPYGTGAGPGGPNGNVAGPGGSYGNGGVPGGRYGNGAGPGGSYGKDGTGTGPGGQYASGYPTDGQDGKGPEGHYDVGEGKGRGGQYGSGAVPGDQYGGGSSPNGPSVGSAGSGAQYGGELPESAPNFGVPGTGDPYGGNTGVGGPDSQSPVGQKQGGPGSGGTFGNGPGPTGKDGRESGPSVQQRSPSDGRGQINNAGPNLIGNGPGGVIGTPGHPTGGPDGSPTGAGGQYGSPDGSSGVGGPGNNIPGSQYGQPDGTNVPHGHPLGAAGPQYGNVPGSGRINGSVPGAAGPYGQLSGVGPDGSPLAGEGPNGQGVGVNGLDYDRNQPGVFSGDPTSYGGPSANTGKGRPSGFGGVNANVGGGPSGNVGYGGPNTSAPGVGGTGRSISGTGAPNDRNNGPQGVGRNDGVPSGGPGQVGATANQENSTPGSQNKGFDNNVGSSGYPTSTLPYGTPDNLQGQQGQSGGYNTVQPGIGVNSQTPGDWQGGQSRKVTGPALQTGPLGTTNAASGTEDGKDIGIGKPYSPGNLPGDGTQINLPDRSPHGNQTDPNQQRYNVQSSTDPFTSTSGVQNEPGWNGIPGFDQGVPANSQVPPGGLNNRDVPGSNLYNGGPQGAQFPNGTAFPDATGQTGAGYPVGTGQTGAGFPGVQGQTGAGYPVGPGQTGAGFPDATGQTGAGYPVGTGQTGAGFPGVQGQTGAGYPVGPGQTGAGFPDGQGQTGAGYPVGPGQTGSGFPDGQGQTGAGYPGGPGQTGNGFPDGQGQTGAGYPGGPSQTGSGFPDWQGQTGVGYPFSPGQTGSEFPDGQGQTGAGFPNGQTGAGYPSGPGHTGTGLPGGPDQTGTVFPGGPGQVGAEFADGGAHITGMDGPGSLSGTQGSADSIPYGQGGPDSALRIDGAAGGGGTQFPGLSKPFPNGENANEPFRKTGTDTGRNGFRQPNRLRTDSESSIRRSKTSGVGPNGKNRRQDSTGTKTGVKKPSSPGPSKGHRKGTGFRNGSGQDSTESSRGSSDGANKPSGTPVKSGVDGGRTNLGGETSKDGTNGKDNRFGNNGPKGVPSVKKGVPANKDPCSNDYNTFRKGPPGLNRKPSLGTNWTRDPQSKDKSKLEDFCDNLPGYYAATPDRKKKMSPIRNTFQSPFSVIYPSGGECPPGTIRTKEGFFAIPKDKPRSKNVRPSENNCKDFRGKDLKKKKHICDSGTQVECIPIKKPCQNIKNSGVDKKLFQRGSSPSKAKPRNSKDAKLMEELKAEVLKDCCFHPTLVRPMSQRKGCSGVSTEWVNEHMDFNLASLPMSEESFQRLRAYLEKYLKDYAKLLTEAREEDILRLCSMPYRPKDHLSGPPRDYSGIRSSSQGYGYGPTTSGCDNRNNRSNCPCRTQPYPCASTSSANSCPNSSNKPASYRIFSVDKIVLNNSPTLSELCVSSDDKKVSINEEFDRAEELTLNALKFSHSKCTNPKISDDSLFLQPDATSGDLNESSNNNSDLVINRAIESILKDLSVYKKFGHDNYVFSKDVNLTKDVNRIEPVETQDEDSCNVTKINSCSSSATIIPGTSSTDFLNFNDFMWVENVTQNQPSQSQSISEDILAVESCSYNTPIVENASSTLETVSSESIRDTILDQNPRTVNNNPSSSLEPAISQNDSSVASLNSGQITDALDKKPFKSNLKSKRTTPDPEIMKSRSVRFSDPVVRDSWILGFDDLFGSHQDNREGNSCSQKPYYVAMFGQTASHTLPGECALPSTSSRVTSSDCNIQCDEQNVAEPLVPGDKELTNDNKFKSHLV